MAPLSASSLEELFTFATRAANERAELRRLMAELPESWRLVKATLNELLRLIGSPNADGSVAPTDDSARH